MKKFMIIFICFLFVFPLTACDTKNELGKNSIVTVIFADYKNGEYLFWAETTDFPDFKQEKEEKGAFLCYAQGNSVYTAWEKLKSTFSKIPYFGHVRAIVLKEGFTKRNFNEILSFFLNDNSLSPNTSVFFTNEKPDSFRMMKIAQMVSNKTLAEMKMYNLFSPRNYCCDIPVLKCRDKNPYCDSTALIKNFSYDFTMEKNDFFIYSLLKNRNYHYIYKDFEIPCSKASVKTKNDVAKIKLKININTMFPNEKNKVQKEMEADIKKFLENLKGQRKTYILTNESFSQTQMKIYFSVNENSKLKQW